MKAGRRRDIRWRNKKKEVLEEKKIVASRWIGIIGRIARREVLRTYL